MTGLQKRVRAGVGLAATLVVAGLVAACGGGSPHSTTNRAFAPARPETSAPKVANDESFATAPAREQTHPSLTPRTGTTTTRFALRLTVREPLGAHGTSRRLYRIVLKGPRPRCSVFTDLDAAKAGARASVPLVAPIELGWCRGTFHGMVVLETSPSCVARGKGETRCGAFKTRELNAGRFVLVTR
jgi:hypothetical protein